jgi:hypothetical protein
MEYLEGTDLSAMLQNHGPLPVELASELIVQACDALAEAHSIGIVHRDLKPANLFVTHRSDGTPLVKVLDFGISKTTALTEGAVAMTQTSALMGSPLYMSPEQMRSAKDVDQRSDVWSLGIVLYELLVGRVPFRSESLGELLYTVMTVPHQPIHAMLDRPDIPPGVSAVVDWCLRKEPAERAPNVAEVARRLAPFCPPRMLPTIERISAVLRPPGFQGPITQSGPVRPGSLGGHAQAPGSFPGAASNGLTVPTPPVQSQPHAQTSAGWGGTSPGKGKGSPVPWIAAGIGALVVLGAAGFGLRAALHTGASSASPASAAVTAVAVEAPTPPPTPPPGPSVEPVAPSTAAAAATADPRTVATVVPAAAGVAPTASSPPSVEPRAAPRPVAAPSSVRPPRAANPPTPATRKPALTIPDTSN